MSVTDISSPPTHLGLESNGMHLAPEEYDAVQEWDPSYRYELVHGVLIVSPPAVASERSPNDYLGHLILNYQEGHPLGSIVDETLPEQEIKTGDNRRRADRAVWVGLGRPLVTEDDVPTIAVEFVSGRSRDRHRDYVEKRREYAAAGVQEYWVIDRFRREMTVFCGLLDEIVIAEGELYKTPLLPRFELAVADLLARAERYKSDD